MSKQPEICPTCGALPCDWTETKFWEPSDRDECYELLVPVTASPSEAFEIAWAAATRFAHGETEERFWQIIDQDGLAPVPSDMWDALDRTVRAARHTDPHEVFWTQFSDCGQHIRKWSRAPFEGGRMCRVEIAA